jgi:hypothetical protein
VAAPLAARSRGGVRIAGARKPPGSAASTAAAAAGLVSAPGTRGVKVAVKKGKKRKNQVVDSSGAAEAGGEAGGEAAAAEGTEGGLPRDNDLLPELGTNQITLFFFLRILFSA